MLNEVHSCIECRYFLPTGDTHYNKPCGYCGNFSVRRTRISDDKACKLFELAARSGNKKPDG